MIKHGPAVLLGFLIVFVISTPVVLLFGGEQTEGLVATHPQLSVYAVGVGWAAGTLAAIMLGWRRLLLYLIGLPVRWSIFAFRKIRQWSLYLIR